MAFRGDLACSGLNIGGLQVAIHHDPSCGIDFGGAARAFAPSDAPPDLDVDLQLTDVVDEPQGVVRFDSGATWRLLEDDGERVIRLGLPGDAGLPHAVLRLDQGRRTGTLQVARSRIGLNGALRVLEYPLDELLWVLLLARHQGLLLHALGGVDARGQGFVCAGVSGAGKSTLARLWNPQHPATVLSDDRVIVRLVDGRPWIHGTPWHGEDELASAQSAPLARVYFIEQADRDELVELSAAQAMARLLALSFLPFFSAEDLGACADLAAVVARQRRCQVLRFTPSASAWQLVDDDLGRVSGSQA
ncbi:MAG: hypothetical protein ABIJ09_00650 [Pseudomonadota bacterium]